MKERFSESHYLSTNTESQPLFPPLTRHVLVELGFPRNLSLGVYPLLGPVCVGVYRISPIDGCLLNNKNAWLTTTVMAHKITTKEKKSQALT